MTLLERDELLAQLQAHWRAAGTEAGRLVVVEGEAGIGKTTLMRAFAQSLGKGVPVRWGACDALSRPRPLGPLHDMLDGVSSAEQDGDRHALFVKFLELLAARSTLAVLEDLHWADEATLDLLRYIGRRMTRTHSLLLVSLRSDELTAQHPLRGVLGDLATLGVARLVPRPLSPAAVQVLAAAHAGTAALDLDALHRTTGGNPFFVTEVLAAHAGGATARDIPASVSDAVLARAARLGPSARALLDAAAVAGPRIEPWLMRDLAGAEAAAIDECLGTGVLSAEASALAFRHELARQVILQSMAPARALGLHRLVLQALQARTPGASPARLAHHAEGAGDAEAALRWALAAAREAAAAGAHRQAAEQYALALRHAPAADRAALLDVFAVECRICGRLQDALDAQRDAARAWRALGNRGCEAVSFARFALWSLAAGRRDEGEAAIREALALIAAPDADAAAVIVVKQHAAAMFMMDHNTEPTLALAGEVLRAAQQRADERMVVQAHTIIGTVLIVTERCEEGIDHLQRALAGAEARRDDMQVAQTLLNLGSGCTLIYRLELAEHWLSRGIRFCAERDIDMSRLYQLASLATVRLHQGRWDEASAALHEVLSDQRTAAVARIIALATLGRLRARRGDPGVWEALDEARTLAIGTGALQRLATTYAARAEAAWLEGRTDDAAREAEAALPLALAHGSATFAAELLRWTRRGGADDVAVPAFCAAHPFGLEAAGQWRRAAQVWTQLDCPYEAACARAESGDVAMQREALRLFESLGAQPMIERTRHRLRRAGVRGLPRGPRVSTRQHPAGLTSKELAVLALLASGLRNKEIAERVNRSIRTVDHHVQAIFAKLDVTTRTEAVSAAHRIGILVGGAGDGSWRAGGGSAR
jgi:DNA-binding CsgD family transcriptional regulator